MKNNNKYKQINQEERVLIAELWRRNKSYYYIAKFLNRKYDTIKNEIERNGKINQFGKIIYSVRKAKNKYLKRRKESKESKRIIESNYLIEEKIIKLITKEQYSPEQIANRFNTVSHQTIYNWLWRMEDVKLKKKIVKSLRRKGKTYRVTSRLHTYESITAPKTMINKRPKVINERKRLGDFEGDLDKLNGKEVLYTLVDRKSRYTFITYLSNGYADLVNQATIKIWNKLKKKKLIKTITFDNGVEFSKHDLLTVDTKLPIYFCFPYHSWDFWVSELNEKCLSARKYRWTD